MCLWNEIGGVPLKLHQSGRRKVAEEKDERVAVAKSNFNVGGVIAAVALLLLVLGLLKFMGVSPI